MQVMIDFHYSDSRADPGQQTKPAAWANLSAAQLANAVYDHTQEVLSALQNAGVDVQWVQVGNETNNGMLWPEGRASTNMPAFAHIIEQGYRAVKAVYPQAKVIVHVSNGYDNNLYRWLFDGLKANNAQWDVIGLSLYPDAVNYTTLTHQALNNMNDMVQRLSLIHI